MLDSIREKGLLFVRGKKKWLYMIFFAGLILTGVLLSEAGSEPDEYTCAFPEPADDKISGNEKMQRIEIAGSDRIRKTSELQDPFGQGAENKELLQAAAEAVPPEKNNRAEKIPVQKENAVFSTAAERPVLTGILHVGDQAAALLDFSGKTVMIREGGQLAGWCVNAVGEDCVEIDNGKETILLQLGTGRKKEKVATAK